MSRAARRTATRSQKPGEAMEVGRHRGGPQGLGAVVKLAVLSFASAWRFGAPAATSALSAPDIKRNARDKVACSQSLIGCWLSQQRLPDRAAATAKGTGAAPKLGQPGHFLNWRCHAVSFDKSLVSQHLPYVSGTRTSSVIASTFAQRANCPRTHPTIAQYSGAEISQYRTAESKNFQHLRSICLSLDIDFKGYPLKKLCKSAVRSRARAFS